MATPILPENLNRCKAFLRQRESCSEIAPPLGRVHVNRRREAWHLAASDATASASQIVNLYAKRWTIEPGFRDKDLRFGMGLSVLRIGDPQRRDRLLLLNALAILLLTLLGAAAKAWAWTDRSEPARSNAASIRCSARAACSTISSPTCPNNA